MYWSGGFEERSLIRFHYNDPLYRPTLIANRVTKQLPRAYAHSAGTPSRENAWLNVRTHARVPCGVAIYDRERPMVRAGLFTALQLPRELRYASVSLSHSHTHRACNSRREIIGPAIAGPAGPVPTPLQGRSQDFRKGGAE